MDTEDQIYRDLQKWLERLPSGYLPTKSGSDIRLLKHWYTPEEAKLAMQLSMRLEPLKRIYNRVKKKRDVYRRARETVRANEIQGYHHST
jgi:electron transport complex protein RnfB